jgi:hypothetical protein
MYPNLSTPRCEYQFLHISSYHRQFIQAANDEIFWFKPGVRLKQTRYHSILHTQVSAKSNTSSRTNDVKKPINLSNIANATELTDINAPFYIHSTLRVLEIIRLYTPLHRLCVRNHRFSHRCETLQHRSTTLPELEFCQARTTTRLGR